MIKMSKIKIRDYVLLWNVIEIEGFPCPYGISLDCFTKSVRHNRIIGKFKAIYVGVNRLGVRGYEIAKKECRP